MSLWTGKKYVKVFQPTTVCRMRLSDLLVYSYLAYQDAFDTSPGTMQIVRGVGLSKDTVHRARERLGVQGLYSDDAVQPPSNDLFYPADRKCPSHWRDNYAYWHYYVRSADSSLTTLQTAVLSFLWHLRQTRPGFRLSITFLSLLLCAKRDTVSAALEVLQSEGLLDYEISKRKVAALKVRLRQLTAADLRLFQDVGIDDDRHLITVMDDRAHADPAAMLRGELSRIFEDDELAAKLERKLTATPSWQRNKTEILSFCRKCPGGDQGVFEFREAMKMGLAS